MKLKTLAQAVKEPTQLKINSHGILVDIDTGKPPIFPKRIRGKNVIVTEYEAMKNFYIVAEHNQIMIEALLS